jgi:hypothetical protein
MNLPDFQHPSLKRTVARTAPRIEAFTATLDRVSQDIRAAEKWLRDHQVRIEAEAVYHTSSLQTERPDALESGTAPVTQVTRAVGWAETLDGKAWRLQFREYHAEGVVHLEHGVALDPPRLAHSRPLIETPAAIRLEAVDTLPRLLEKIAAAIPGETAGATAAVPEPGLVVEGTLHVLAYGEGGADLAFAPSGNGGGSVPLRRYAATETLAESLRVLGFGDSPIAELLASLKMSGNATLRLALPVSALRGLGLLGEGSAPYAEIGMPDRDMAPFDTFRARLKAELVTLPEPQTGAHILTVRKWSQYSGEMPGAFTLIYRGGDTLACDTASTNNWRNISFAEIRRVYEVWRDYRTGRRGRAYITHHLGVQNTTWIIPLLRRYEHLMF